jgi:hypothetical protein
MVQNNFVRAHIAIVEGKVQFDTIWQNAKSAAITEEMLQPVAYVPQSHSFCENDSRVDRYKTRPGIYTARYL